MADRACSGAKLTTEPAGCARPRSGLGDVAARPIAGVRHRPGPVERGRTPHERGNDLPASGPTAEGTTRYNEVAGVGCWTTASLLPTLRCRPTGPRHVQRGVVTLPRCRRRTAGRAEPRRSRGRPAEPTLGHCDPRAEPGPTPNAWVGQSDTLGPRQPSRDPGAMIGRDLHDPVTDARRRRRPLALTIR